MANSSPGQQSEKGKLAGLRVAVVHGDDVRRQVLERDLELPEMGTRASAMASAEADRKSVV